MKTAFQYCLIMLMSLHLIACSQPVKLRPLATDDIILAFGDSLTEGRGVNKVNSYPSMLQKMSGRTVINSGISGETTGEGLKRIKRELDKHQPRLMILMHGGNDILRDAPKETTKSNLISMVAEAQKRDIEVVLIAVPNKRVLSTTAPVYPEVAEQLGLSIDESSVSEIMKQPKLKSDIVHFNKEGYQLLAEKIFSLLKNSGAL